MAFVPKFAREEGSGALREKDKALSEGLYSQEVSAGSKRTLKVALVPTRPTQVGPGCCGKVESASAKNCPRRTTPRCPKVSKTQDLDVSSQIPSEGSFKFQNFHSGGHGWTTIYILNRVQNSIGARAAWSAPVPVF